MINKTSAWVPAAALVFSLLSLSACSEEPFYPLYEGTAFRCGHSGYEKILAGYQDRKICHVLRAPTVISKDGTLIEGVELTLFASYEKDDSKAGEAVWHQTRIASPGAEKIVFADALAYVDPAPCRVHATFVISGSGQKPEVRSVTLGEN